jgi:hypothetical protein
MLWICLYSVNAWFSVERQPGTSRHPDVMAMLTKLPLIGRFFGSPPKKAASVRDWQDEYRAACFVLKSFDSAVLGEIKASYMSELNFWTAPDEASLLTGEWEVVQKHYDAWVAARSVDTAWNANVTRHIGRSLHEIGMLYRHQPDSDELRLFLEVLGTRLRCFGITSDSAFAEPYPIANRGGWFAWGEPSSLPDVPSERLTAWLLLEVKGVLDIAITNSTPGYQAHLAGIDVYTQKINQMTVLQSFGDLKDEDGMIRYEPVQEMLRRFVWLRAFGGMGPALSVEDSAVERLFNMRNDLWREHRPRVLVKEHPVPWEPMTFEHILMSWRAVHAAGGAAVDLTEYIPGSRPSWAAWSGSAWVAMREHMVRSAPSTSEISDRELALSLALPPGFDPDTEAARKTIGRYGQWLTETEYQPPPN